MPYPLRILLLEVPQLLRGIIEHAIQAHGGCELIKAAPAVDDPGGYVPMSPDVVVLGLSAIDDVALVSTLFARWPRAQIMAMMPDGDDVVLYELRPHRTAMKSMTPAEMIAAMFTAVRGQRDRNGGVVAGEEA